jgi:hypothetical protein
MVKPLKKDGSLNRFLRHVKYKTQFRGCVIEFRAEKLRAAAAGPKYIHSRKHAAREGHILEFGKLLNFAYLNFFSSCYIAKNLVDSSIPIFLNSVFCLFFGS